SGAERKTLTAMALAAIDRDVAMLPAEWATARRAELSAALRREDSIDKSYQQLSKSTMAAAAVRAQMADVRGLERLMARVRSTDAALGMGRPEAVNALVAAIEEKLDAARRLQLARERWAMRAPAFHEYNLAIRRPIDLFVGVTPLLDGIKDLSGSAPASLLLIEQRAAEIV